MKTAKTKAATKTPEAKAKHTVVTLVVGDTVWHTARTPDGIQFRMRVVESGDDGAKIEFDLPDGVGVMLAGTKEPKRSTGRKSVAR